MTYRTSNSIAFAAALLIFILAGCKPSVPGDFLQPDEMEVESRADKQVSMDG